MYLKQKLAVSFEIKKYVCICILFSKFLFQHRSCIKRRNSLCFRISFNLARKKSIFLKKIYWLQELNCLYTFIAMHFCNKQYICITTGNIILSSIGCNVNSILGNFLELEQALIGKKKHKNLKKKTSKKETFPQMETKHVIVLSTPL